MKAKFLTLIFTLFFSLPVGLFAGPLDGMCIALVHGILGFDDTQGLAGGLVKYWGGMDTYLRSQGAKVTTPGSSPLNSIQKRSELTRDALIPWMAANGCTKVHLIGHSQGGLVVRYMASNSALGFNTSANKRVATVSTVDAVHKGAPLADIVLGVIPSWLQPFANTALGLFSQLFYGAKPMDVIAMGKSLAVSTVNSFNAATPNFTGLKYYSYGNKMAWADPIQHVLMAPTYPITWAGGLFYGLGSANDGVVPLESQKWGNYKGEASAKWFATGIDHLQATNFQWSGQNFFDVTGWYLGIAQTAKAGL
ncbi:MAG TPA: lipase [Leptospiraceae bacterium]|nr:lipase [Leptospiraceae bacterium]HMW04391.1 lipase [Leptospiraceae bacterium]HMX31039.1 lipase [Leptospiraceae bacterium]HMY34133.1 lipase [Leptospiraceae bacterium]HMZ63844.1 lipase [Leptospiraceae bacterium]